MTTVRKFKNSTAFEMTATEQRAGEWFVRVTAVATFNQTLKVAVFGQNFNGRMRSDFRV